MLIVITLHILIQYANDYIMLNFSDMFRVAIWTFYYKLMNNKLASYFNYMKPNLPVICNYYGIRNQNFIYQLLDMGLPSN